MKREAIPSSNTEYDRARSKARSNTERKRGVLKRSLNAERKRAGSKAMLNVNPKSNVRLTTSLERRSENNAGAMT